MISDRYKQSINTIRGGTILMNAIILAMLCGRKYVKIQWIAILIQVSVVLMVRNEDFIILFQNSPIVHILMIVSVFVTAVCASAFDSLTKANFNIPLMTINMIFFGFEFCFNMMAAMISVFISNSTLTTSRIYWFETVCVMVNGIMSTFIYKYFDSVAESLIQQSMGIVLVNHTFVNVNDIIGYVIILGTINLFVSESKTHHSLSSKRLEEIESDIIQGSVRIKSGARSGKKSVAFRYLKYFIGFLLTVLFVVLMIGMLAYYGIQLNHLKANKLSELSTYQRHKMDITRV
ncbi:hypothetical protein BC833DRAFT_342411 [Globomyces pollinis-pini]|nr:hypothetical protein BC833DRAFT_342411 [Globomyces pollinis-pini]